MNSSSISVIEALELLKRGKTLKGYSITFGKAKIKALDAFQLGKAGIDVPDELIEYDDADVAYDPDFDDYAWKRTDQNPVIGIKDKLTVNIEVDHNVNTWLQKNDIDLDHLLEKLIHDFYSAHQLIRSR